VATLSIVTAAILRQPFAGLVIVVMQSGGELLEKFVARRASRALQELEDASPRLAHRMDGDQISDVSAGAVRAGDVQLVRPSEPVPADCVVVSGTSWIDASRLPGESRPMDVGPGSQLMSGSVNGDRPLTVRATARAGESQYARIVQLVRSTGAAGENNATAKMLLVTHAAFSHDASCGTRDLLDCLLRPKTQAGCRVAGAFECAAR